MDKITKAKKQVTEPEKVDSNDITIIQTKKETRLGDVVADNFGEIVKIATSIVEIEKMKVQTDAAVRQMEQARLMILQTVLLHLYLQR